MESFPGSWAVLIFQSAIAEGGGKDIDIFLDLDKIRFVFMPPRHWDASLVRQALANPNLPDEEPLRRFVQGLRVVEGLFESYRVNFGEGSTLEWRDGEYQSKAGSRQDWGRLQLAVFLEPQNALRAQQQANVHHALASRCFVSPCPLRLDGRQIDNFFTGFREWSHEVHGSPQLPIAAGFIESNLPTWRVPAQSFSKLFSERVDTNLSDEGKAGVEKASLAYRIGAVGVNENNATKLRGVRPLVFWLHRGALVHYEELSSQEFPLAVTLFCSAEGLAVNSDGLTLAQSPEKQTRMDTICRLMGSALQGLGVEPGEDGESSLIKRPKILAGGILLIPFLVFSPALAKPLILASTVVGSGAALLRKLSQKNEADRSVAAALATLQQDWPKAFTKAAK